jgi:hypothetical protein
MKRVFFVFGIFLIVFLNSCTKEKETVYSCNESVDEFVKTNLREFGNISYDTLITYDIEYQKGIFNSVSSQKKCDLWIEKLNRTLLLEWTNEEEAHIQELRDLMNADWYDIEINESLMIQRDNYLQSWRSRGVDIVGFDDRMLFSIAGRIDIPVNPEEPASMMQTELGGGSSVGVGDPQQDCDCSQGDDWCWGSTDCLDETCSGSAHGCGTVWTHRCDGNCGADI